MRSDFFFQSSYSLFHILFERYLDRGRDAQIQLHNSFTVAELSYSGAKQKKQQMSVEHKRQLVPSGVDY